MGRAPGSLNRRTRLMLPMLEALEFRDPALVLAEIASMPELRLRKWTRTEAGRHALAARIKAATELMPYCHSKMPVQVNTELSLPIINIYGDRDQLQGNQQLSLEQAGNVGRNDVGQLVFPFENAQQFEDKADD